MKDLETINQVYLGALLEGLKVSLGGIQPKSLAQWMRSKSNPRDLLKVLSNGMIEVSSERSTFYLKGLGVSLVRLNNNIS